MRRERVTVRRECVRRERVRRERVRRERVRRERVQWEHMRRERVLREHVRLERVRRERVRCNLEYKIKKASEDEYFLIRIQIRVFVLEKSDVYRNRFRRTNWTSFISRHADVLEHWRLKSRFQISIRPFSAALNLNWTFVVFGHENSSHQPEAILPA